ncbi:MAG TPA: O-antigen ligase family protein [Thermoanaerobaculia bacterium]|nr:O-antigen ligase family protein [Thermoanaerobaculia bacterium]
MAALLGCLGWAALLAFVFPLMLPPFAGYRTAVALAALVLFGVALASPASAFVLAFLAATLGGVSALAFGASEPLAATPLVLFGYFAGASLKDLYDMRPPVRRPPLLVPFRAFAAVSAVSGASAFVGLRTSYLLTRGVGPPFTINVLGEDARQVLPSVLGALLPLLVAAGMHRIAARFVAAGRSALLDRALLASALLAGGVALLQKTGALPLLRSRRWAEWHRAQSTFTDPSAAGVAVALLIVPLLALAATGTITRRLLASVAGAALLVVLADAGSRAGLVGTVTATLVFVLWGLTRLAAGESGGARRRVAGTIGALAILSALVLAAALSWPNRGAVRSALLARLEAPFRTQPTPFEETRSRLLLYEGAWEAFREHPVTGIGLGAFRIVFPDLASKELGHSVRTSDHPPSLYLGTLAESGLAGASLLALLLLGVIRSAGRALTLEGDSHDDESVLRAAAAASMIGLGVVFLFGSHLVYAEIAAFVGLLTARLPLREDGHTGRFLVAVVPVVLAGALVCAIGGVVARAWDTRSAEAAFRNSSSAGVFDVERDPGGRPFRWTGASAAWVVERPALPTGSGSMMLTLQVRDGRPDGRPAALDVFFDDVLRGRVTLPPGAWRRLEVPIPPGARGVLRIRAVDPFRPASRRDRRLLGIQIGSGPTVVPAAP